MQQKVFLSISYANISLEQADEIRDLLIQNGNLSKAIITYSEPTEEEE